jgi:hypothetical protein
VDEPSDKVPFTKAHVQLSPRDLPAIDAVAAKIGSRVRIVLYGTLAGLEKTQEDKSMTEPDAGSLDIDVSKIDFASSSELDQMFSEESDG